VATPATAIVASLPKRGGLGFIAFIICSFGTSLSEEARR